VGLGLGWTVVGVDGGAGATRTASGPSGLKKARVAIKAYNTCGNWRVGGLGTSTKYVSKLR